MLDMIYLFAYWITKLILSMDMIILPNYFFQPIDSFLQFLDQRVTRLREFVDLLVLERAEEQLQGDQVRVASGYSLA